MGVRQIYGCHFMHTLDTPKNLPNDCLRYSNVRQLFYSRLELSNAYLIVLTVALSLFDNLLQQHQSL
jgi:hypothetical protein